MSDDRIYKLGIVAICGGLLNTIADLFILSQPIYVSDQGIRVLELMPVNTVRIGVILGFFALTSWLCLLPSLLAGFGRASIVERWLIVASFGLFVASSLVFHCLYWPATVAVQAVAGSDAYDLLIQDVEAMLAFFQMVIIASLLVLTITLISALVRKQADYPWWIIVVSPLVVFFSVSSLGGLLPAPYRGYLAAITGTVSGTVFMMVVVLARHPSASVMVSEKSQ